VKPTHNVFGSQTPLSGDAFVGIYAFTYFQPELWSEYIQVQLLEALQGGVRYKVSFHVSLADEVVFAVNKLGAYLSENPLENINGWNLDVEPQILNATENLLTDTSSWVLVTDTFASRAGGGERYITIGNFFPPTESDTMQYRPGFQPSTSYSYYYIDDVSVIALDSVPNNIGEVASSDESFAVYPNPASGFVTIEYALEDKQVGVLNMYDLTGSILFSRLLNSSTSKMNIELEGIASGLYLMQLEINGQKKLSQRISVLKP
jgi:hypothetical protein